MSLRPLLAAFAAVFAMLPLTGCDNSRDRGPIVLAAASLQGSLEEVADDWAALGHARPVLSFGGTSALARQAEGGAPADIFFSADGEWMDWLEERDLIDRGSRRDLLSNRLVVIGQIGTRSAWQSPQALSEVIGADRLAMADPHAVPAGRYARRALENLGDWATISGRVVPVENVRAALALVERGEVPFAVVYATDAMASSMVERVGTIPEAATPKIAYPVARLVDSTHPDAPAFLAYLATASARETFRRHGFGVAP